MRNEYFEELIRRNDILAVARELGLEVRGSKCRCFHPETHAHGDRTPSLSLNRARNSFRCWVCPDVWGSVIDLVMLARGVPRREAVAYLAARCGMPAPGRVARALADGAGMPVPHPGGPSLLSEPASCYTAPRETPPLDEGTADRIYREFLRWCDRPGPRGYLTRRRGLSVAILDRMRVVWVSDAERAERHLREDFAEEDLMASGLFTERGLIFRHHRLVFPFVYRRHVRFLQGRRTGPGEPKYLSLRRPIPCLYNHDMLDVLEPEEPVVLCEGVIDTLTWLDRGVAAVGTLGVGTLKEEWIQTLRPFRVILSFDADEPGQRAARALQQRLAAAGRRAPIVALPQGVKDVNQFFTRERRVAVRQDTGSG